MSGEDRRAQWSIRVGEEEISALEVALNGLGKTVTKATVQRAALRIGLRELTRHKTMAKRLEAITAALED